MGAAEEYVAVPYEGWKLHPWLSRLEWGSDDEGDGAWFFTWDAPAPLAALDRVIVQYKDTGEWTDCTRADGGIFPGHDWATAVVGWFQRIDFSTYAAVDSLRGDVEYRALVPASWDCESVPTQAMVPVVDRGSDWESQEWKCINCDWSGPLERAAVFSEKDVNVRVRAVSIACPSCGCGLATIERGNG